MHPERVWIALLILAAVLVGSNLLMVALTRGFRSFRGDYFKSFNDATHPWKKEDEDLKELSERVRDLNPEKDKNDLT